MSCGAGFGRICSSDFAGLRAISVAIRWSGRREGFGLCRGASGRVRECTPRPVSVSSAAKEV